ncbi:magnesium-translocating P-type ATPase [Homoserinimonas sp. OAct 916]|uniref:magnesium-translocating P-type ATPase n=1 Tax=Homoserinimonas sp. OAct 916 TaxID=2211450 RepID=UPI000DBE02B9|nr:magnesium-translocating P-type ATPase [Homoserinimonas sp. OAct 916]
MTTRPSSETDDREASVISALDSRQAACLEVYDVCGRMGVDDSGLSSSEAAARLARFGPNAVSSHRARALLVLWHQVRSPLLGLLLIAAVASSFVGEISDAIIIGVIVALSIGLGFVNEYRAEKAAESLHSQIHHRATVIRDGRRVPVDVTGLVPGDVTSLQLGDIVPADIRLSEVQNLECDESTLTGESSPVEKSVAPVPEHTALAELSSVAMMGSVVHGGAGTGIVIATGVNTEFGRIAAGLGEHQVETQFQVGLRKFSVLLVYVAVILTGSIFVINIALHKPLFDALLFSLAIAVGITPQLLPAVVSASLAAGSKRMSARKVLVKRLVCIEDLGDVDTLFTDKTGTLTVGSISFMRTVSATGAPSADPLKWGLVCTEVVGAHGQAVGGNSLDMALWNSPAASAQASAIAGYERVSILPFDHDRRLVSVLVRDAAGTGIIVTKGAPETVLERCTHVPASAESRLDAEFAAGNRVIAVATRAAEDRHVVTPADERDLTLVGFLVFLDPAKPDAEAALKRLSALGVSVKVITGDSAVVATKVCDDLGLVDGGTLTGVDLDAIDDTRLAAVIAATRVFARVSPEQKARIVSLQRRTGGDVAFLGDGVNDALALHAADVGISVDSATDVAKDAADVILLEKDLNVLADGVMEGRRIFANTIKYVLMGTSSNFGNMFSAAGASIFLPFLPMLPSQILLNNLIYDASQLAIPTDNVDEEQLRKPSQWDIRFIRRFMLIFGPLSSVFDFILFGVMLWGFNAGPELFHTGWFVESLATQTLVIFAIRTRRIPFFRSHPSLPLTLAALAAVTIGIILPASPLAGVLGFSPLPVGFFAVLALMVVGYLVLVEFGKTLFYRMAVTRTGDETPRAPRADSHLRRRMRRFSTAERLSPAGRSKR